MGQMNFYAGHQLGAPALGTLGTGDLKRVLDACLVDGFTAQSATIAVASGIATVTLASHKYVKNQRITVAGVTGGGTGFATMNKVTRILSSASGTFTLDATGIANGALTGSITVQLAGLGWAKAFTGTNTSAYRAAAGNRYYFMCNDNANTNTCIVRAFQTMTAVTTGTNPFPTTTQSNTNLKWLRPDPTSQTADNDSWVVVGDDKRFFIGICIINPGYRFWAGFGDFQSFKPSDAYNTFMMGAGNSAGDDTQAPIGGPTSYATIQQSAQTSGQYYTPGIALARAANQTTLSYLVGVLGAFVNNGSWQSSQYFSDTSTPGRASDISGVIELGFVDIIEQVPSVNRYNRRGRLPWVVPWQYCDFPNNHLTSYSPGGAFPDVLIVAGGYYDQNAGIIWPIGDWDTVLAA